MKRRTLLVTAAVTPLGIAACSDPGSGNDTGAEADTDTTWPDPAGNLDGVTLTIWAAQNSNTAPDEVVAGFQQATGATVDVVTVPDPYEQGIQTKVATGDKPDIAFWQPTASMLTAINATTNLQPLTDAPWLPAMAPELRDLTGMLDDTRYAALITSPAVIGVYYNKEVFDANGITAMPGNFDELVELGRELKAGGVTPFYEMAADRWATQWWVQVQLADAAEEGLWERINAGEDTFSSPAMLDAITRYKSLIDEGLFNDDITTAKFEDQGNALLNGETAMVIQVNSFFDQLQAMSDTATLDERIGFFAISPSGNVGTFIPDQSNSLVAFKTGDDERESAARQLLAYWLGQGYPDFVTDRNTVSLQPDVANPSGVPQALLDVHSALSTSVGSMQVLAVANPDLYINLADMIAGTMTPEQVAEATQDQFEQMARAAGVAGF